MKNFADTTIKLQEPNKSPYPVYDPPIPEEPVPNPVPNPEPTPEPTPNPNPNPTPFPMPPEPIPSFPPDVKF
jgi:hypothetical protein